YAFVSYIQKQRRNNHKDFQHCLFACFISQIKPKKIFEALEDESWVDAMQEELLQFKIQKVWILVDLPYEKKAIGTKWVYRNKKDERGVLVRNKVRLVAQGHRKEEGIDYDDVFAPMARIEAIRIFLAFALYMGFIVYHMDVKSAFLYGTIDEESGYRRGTIDKTLFIKKDKNDIMLVQVYVDDIIFGSTKRSWSAEFEALMKSRFLMSSMEELTFFLGLQKPLVKDKEATDVDVHLYRSMIGSLMYLTASRPDIMYLKGKPKLGLWYPRVSSFDLEAYSDSDYAGANLDRKSTTGEAEYVAAANCCRQFSTSAKSRTVNNISYIDAIVSGKPVTISEASIRSDLLFDDADGIDTLNNQAIFNTIQLIGFDGMMRHLDAFKKFVMYPRFLQIFLRNQLRDVHVPMDHFPVPVLTKKVLTFMVKKGKNFSGNVTPLFHSMLVQPTKDEGEVSERPSKSQPIPSPTHPSKDQPESQPDLYPRPSFSIPIPDFNPEGSGGNHGEASLNEATDTLAQDEGKTDSKVEEPKRSSKTEELHLSGDTLVIEDKGSVENGGSTKGTAEIKDQVLGESDTPTAPTMTSTPTLTVFGDDETIAQVLVTMSQNKVKQKEKEKGVELKNVEDIERPRPTSTRSVLTLKPDSLKSHT
ncbi:putative ribonuclease H-like domain-containing protein, partial [Tanacetum coccineum]